jgi:hypothetical protein
MPRHPIEGMKVSDRRMRVRRNGRWRDVPPSRRAAVLREVREQFGPAIPADAQSTPSIASMACLSALRAFLVSRVSAIRTDPRAPTS